MPAAVVPPLDKRMIRIFLGVTKVSDFMKHARRCPVRAFHCPHVDAGQDATKPWRVFVVTEKCIGRDGRRCQNHGLDFSVQLTDEQRVQAIFQVLQLEPFPYDSQPLLDYCVRYVSTLHHLLPQPRDLLTGPAYLAQDASVAPALARPRSTPHHIRYRSWVSGLIPSSSDATAHAHPQRHSFEAEALTSCSSFTVTVEINNVYCYTKNGQLPLPISVEAKRRDHMLYVCLRQPAILSAFGLKSRVRRLEQKVEIYDALGEKWFRSPAETLWLRLNIKEGLMLKAAGVRITPQLEKYVPKSLSKPPSPWSDTLPGFLASARGSTQVIPAFGPVPPMTVMTATIPEHDVPQLYPPASSRSHVPAGEGSGMPVSGTSKTGNIRDDKTRATKKQRQNNGAAASTSAEIIDISSDEESNPLPATQTNRGESKGPSPSQRPRKRVIVHPPQPQPVVAKPRYSSWKLLPRATKVTKNPEIIVVSDDESSPAAPQRHAPASSYNQVQPEVSQRAISPSTCRQPHARNSDNRETIVISDDEGAAQAVVAPVSTSSQRSAGRFRAPYIEAVAPGSSARAGPSTRNATPVADGHGRSAKGKGKMRATRDDDDDSGVDSDATLV